MAVARIFLTLILAFVFVAMYGDAAAVLRWYCDAVAMRLRQKHYACECAGMSEHNIKNITRRLENICL